MRNYSKFIAALIGAVTVAFSEGLLPEEWNSYLTVLVVFLTALGVYQVENTENMETSEEEFDELDL